MFPQIVRTLINWFPGKSEQHCPVAMMAKYGTKNCWGFGDRHLTDFFIPHRLTPQSGDLLSQSMIQAKESTGSLEIEDVLATMPTDEAARRLAIIGPTGSGKTALLKYLQQIYREHRHQQIHSGMPNLMPTILCLPDIRSMILADRPPSLLSLMAWSGSPETRQRFEHHLQQGDYLVMVDGLDEIDGGSSDDGNCGQSDRSRIVYWLDRQMQIYPNTPFIVTSREIDDRLTPLPQVRMVLELQSFNDRQIQQFLQHWYQLNHAPRSIDSPNQTDLTAQLLAEIKSTRSIAEMATNPLLLKAIAAIYEDRGQIPTRRVELYETLCDILLRDKSTNPADRDRNVLLVKSQLQKLALGLMKQKTSQFTADSLSQICPAENLQLFANLDRFGGLLVEVRSGVYEFVHQSWQAYLAAVEINDSEQAALLVENIQNHWWHETIKFYTAIAENTQVIHAALSAATTLKLAYDCLQNYFIEVPSALWSAFNQKIAAGLEADNPIIFQSAAKVRLKQRCQKLLDREDLVAIDSDYITNAEYQLFINDKRKIAQSRQPDCWSSTRFAPGMASDAIAGVRSNDAEEFCEWLTQQYAGYGIRFRLPTLAEVETHPATNDRLGAWCYGQKNKAIAGISPELWQQWQQQIAIGLDEDINRLLRSQNSLKLDLTRNLTRHLALTLARSQKDRILEQLSHLFQQGKSHEMVKNLKHIHELVFCLGNVDNFDRIRDFALRVSKIRQLFALRKLIRTTQIELGSLRSDFLLIYLCFQGLKNYYSGFQSEPQNLPLRPTMNDRAKLRLPTPIHLLPKSPNQIGYYEQKQNEALNLYAFFLLTDLRHFHNFPVFEGIRIVKEQVD